MKNKITISALGIITLMIILSGVFLHQQAGEIPENDKCGDGICDETEQKNPNICPQDCEDNQDNIPPRQSKCGDGVCGKVEKANPNLCPEDCEDNSDIQISCQNFPPPNFCPGGVNDVIITSTNENGCSVYGCKGEITADIDDSPFGFHPGNADNYSYSYDLGSRWSRGEGSYVVWDWVDVERNGGFNFTNAVAPAQNKVNSSIKINYDELRLETPDDINIVKNISPFRKGGEFKNEEEKAVYYSFVKSTIERYDGDNDLGCILKSPDCYFKGDNQYPSEEVIIKSEKNPVKFWQMSNQLFDTCERSNCRNNYAKNYAEALKITYKAAKEADSSVSILIAGDSKLEEYPAVFKELNGQYLDIVDKHYFGEDYQYNPKDEFDYLKESLVKAGFDLKQLRFWVTETGTYSGDPITPLGKNIKTDLPYQSESQQASGLFKRYVSSLSYKIEKIFWAWNIVEGFKRDGGIFDLTGLVYDGCEFINNKYQCGGELKYDAGKGSKKLAYYTYKLMTNKLEGSDWDNVEIIQESNDAYVYKFTNQGNPIWVAWSDSGSGSVSLNSLGIDNAKVTEAVPDYENGKEIVDGNVDFENMFKESDISDSVQLGDVPVFIKEN